MNQVGIFGRLTRDPELRYTQSGKAVANFAIAVNRYSGDNEADFFECTAFEKQAENIANSCTKGDRLLLWGRLQQDRWEDQQGQKRSNVKIIVGGFNFIEPRKESQQAPPAPPPTSRTQQAPPPNYPPQQNPYGQPPGYIPPGQGYPPQNPGYPPQGPPAGYQAPPPHPGPPQGSPNQYGGFQGNLNDIPF